jgi:hypothetical protein
MLFQLTVSPVIWIDRVMEDMGEKVGMMLSAEASRNRTVEGQDDQGEEVTTIEGLAKKYPWGFPAVEGHTTDPEDIATERAGVLEGKNTFIKRGRQQPTSTGECARRMKIQAC